MRGHYLMTSVLTDQGHGMNPLWGAPRIHCELLKFSINVGLTSVAMYMARHSSPPSQGWKPFLRNHGDGIASIDQFVLPTLSFRLLYGLAHSMPRLAPNLYCWVTAHPAVEWIARQLTESLRLGTPTEVIVRDRGRVYGDFPPAASRYQVLELQSPRRDDSARRSRSASPL